MSMKKVLLASVCAVVSAQATPTSTGFFAELNVGGTYNRFNAQFRPNGVEKSDQIEMAKEHKNAFFVGASVGYGFELNCGFYVGAKVYGLYNSAEIEKKDGLAATVKIENASFTTNYDYLKAKPQFSYGAAIMVGGAIVPNVLVYAQCGFEGTYWKIEDRFYGYANGGAIAITNNKAGEFTQTINGTQVKFNAEDAGEIKRNTFSIVPGIGAKYFFNNGMYVGADCNVAIGIYRELETKNYDKGGSYTVAQQQPQNLIKASECGKIYTGRNVAFRYGLSLGYKF